MRKLLLAGICLVLFSGLGFGQRDSNKVVSKHKQKPSLLISIDGGIGLPSGKFYNQGLTTYDYKQGGGFATTGRNMDLFIGISKIFKNVPHFGLGLLGGENSNDFNIDEYNNYLHQEYHYLTGYAFVVSATNYQALRALTGLYFSYPSSVFSWYFRLMRGMLYLETPEVIVSITQTYPTPDFITKMPSNNVNDLAFNLGAGCSLQVFDGFNILLNIDFFHSNPSFENNYTFPISEFNAYLGVGYMF